MNTMIEEATRERFIYAYKEQSSYSTVDFVQRAIIYFGYAPDMIQTDNDSELPIRQGQNEYILWMRFATGCIPSTKPSARPRPGTTARSNEAIEATRSGSTTT